MTLVVHELISTLSQAFTVGSKNVEIKHVRPHLYKHLAPAGSFFIEIQDSSGQLIAASNALTAAEISSANYFHGHIRFDVTANLKAGRSIRIALKSTGYTYSDSAFIGWCNDFDSRITALGFDDPGAIEAPLATEIWDSEMVMKGIVP